MTNLELIKAIKSHKKVFVTMLVAHDTKEIQAVKKDLIDAIPNDDDDSGMSATTINDNLHLGPAH